MSNILTGSAATIFNGKSFERILNTMPESEEIKDLSLALYKLSNRSVYPILETERLDEVSNSLGFIHQSIRPFSDKARRALDEAAQLCSLIAHLKKEVGTGDKEDVYSFDSTNFGSLDSLLERGKELVDKSKASSRNVKSSNFAEKLKTAITLAARTMKAHLELKDQIKEDYQNWAKAYIHIKSRTGGKDELIDNNPVLTTILGEVSKIIPGTGSSEIERNRFRIALTELADPMIIAAISSPDGLLETYQDLVDEYDDTMGLFLHEGILPLLSASGAFEAIGKDELEVTATLAAGSFGEISEMFDIVEFKSMLEDDSEEVEETPVIDINSGKETPQSSTVEKQAKTEDKEEVVEAEPEKHGIEKHGIIIKTRRKKALGLLWSMLQEIVTDKLDDDELDDKVDELISLSGKLSSKAKNLDPNNHFYVASTGEIGAIELVREASPTTQMDDIIGESFDGMKNHLLDLAKYAEHLNLYTLTAPRGKIKSNLIAIGPYGCGKTEIARAIAGDERFIGVEVSVSDLLTAYFGEFEKNVDRVWAQALEIRRTTGKLVFMLMDEFDSFFGGGGSQFSENHKRVQKNIQAKLDGIVEYEGVVVVGMTNEPKKIPLAILRRFKYVDVVGQLNKEERVTLLKKFLTKGLPLGPRIKKENWEKWGEMMEGATGDIIGRVADDIHYKYMNDFLTKHPTEAVELEEIARKIKAGEEDDDALIKALGKYAKVNGKWIEDVIKSKMAEPVVVEQIRIAERVYKDSDNILNNMHKNDAALK